MSDLITRPDEDGVDVLCPSAGIGMRFSQFHDSRREGPYAELEVRNLVADPEAPEGWSMNGLIKRKRLALLGERSQSPLVKDLLATDARAGRPVADWDYLIESACNRAVDAMRNVMPGVDLADVEAPPERPFLIPRLLPLGEPTVVFADGEGGKSLYALLLALCVVTGRQLVPGYVPQASGPVVYLDWETNAVTHRRRLDSLCRGFGIPVPRGIHYQPMYAPLATAGPSVRALLRRLGAIFAIVDSMGFAAEGDVMGPEGALGLFRALRGWDGTALALHHMSKEEAAKEYGAAQAYGSIYFRNSARCMWELRAREEDAGKRRVALYQRKDNDGDRRGPPVGLEWHWDQPTNTTTVTPFLVSRDQALAAHGGIAFLLHGLLLQGGKTPKELEEITGIDAKRLGDTMRHDTRFKRLSTGGGRGNETIWGVAQ